MGIVDALDGLLRSDAILEGELTTRRDPAVRMFGTKQQN
jgi:hypothetical protein